MYSPTCRRKKNPKIMWSEMACENADASGTRPAAVAALTVLLTGYTYWGFGAGVSLLLVGIQDMGKWQVNKIVATGGMLRVVKSSQHAGLCHVMEGFLNGLGTNRLTSPKEFNSMPGGNAHSCC